MKNQTLQFGNEQAELLSQIGAYLKHFRQDQALSLEEVASATMIPVRTLTAIEEGNLASLPEPVYVQGFIRRYADAIGMDGAEIANAFPTTLQLKPVRPSWRGNVEAQLRPLHLYVLYALLVVSAVSGLSYLLNRSSNASLRYTNVSQQLVSGQPTTQSPVEFYGPLLPNQGMTNQSKKGSTFQSSPSPVSNKAVRIGLTLKGQSWLRIVVDDKTDFEGVLPEGTQRTWEAHQQVIIRAGDAGAVMISHNESKAEPMGDAGAVEEKTFDASSRADGNSSSEPGKTENQPVL
jgi:cytoskeletal protein RodZ